LSVRHHGFSRSSLYKVTSEQALRNPLIECAFDIGIDHPGTGGVRPCQTEHFFDGVVTSSTRAKPVTDPFEASFPKWFQGVFHHGLDTAIINA
jgi:hypothetical protein